jgi:hypothetical protein
MKTLKLLFLFCVLLFTQSALPFTTFNLPLDMIYVNPLDELYVDNESSTPLTLNEKTNDNKVTPNLEDTIIINLNEVVISAGFPEKSHDCLQKQVKYPEFARQQQLEGLVTLTMFFDDDGNVVISDSFGSDHRLENYVHEQLYRLHLKDCAVQVNKPYNLRFTFRLI